MDSRVRKIIRKTKNGSARVGRLIKPLARPLLYPPKIGWKAAKLGAKIAVNGAKIVAGPIQRMLTSERIVTEIGVQDFKNMMLSASKKIVLYQEEINRINLWPVADKDTGYNMAATLLGIESSISQREYSSILELAQDIREASMINARGNAGMIFTGYLFKMLEAVKNLQKVDGLRLSIAMLKGTKGAYHSIFNPVEGTILDVMKASGRKAYETARVKKEKNIVKILEESRRAGRAALDATKEKLEILKKNNVVDAGGMGFLKILEAWLESIKGEVVLPQKDERPPISEIKPAFPDYRYDIVFRIKKIKESELKKLTEELNLLGNSIDVLESEDKIKIHIHADFPEKIKEKTKNFGIAEWKVEDMKEQTRRISERKPLGLIAGETADLPGEFLEKNRIVEIPFTARFPDGEILTRKNFFDKMEEAKKTGRPLATTSAPPFHDFLSAYQKALERFEDILVITLSSKLSGAYSSARIARSMVREKQRIYVFDCFTAEAGEGLAVFKVQELISRGKNRQEIMEFLKYFCPQIKVLIGLKDFSYLARSGRLYLPGIFVGLISLLSKMGVWLLFSLKGGRVRFTGLRFGRHLTEILAEETRKNQKGGRWNAAISYGKNPGEALELKKQLEKQKNIKVLFLSQVSPVVGVHTGPEILILGLSPA
jgi:DegV family protein with EDD domain